MLSEETISTLLLLHVVFGATALLFGSVLGTLGTVFAIVDFRSFRKPDELYKHYLRLHLGKITGGYISAFTAFIVINQYITGLTGWLAPGILGGIFITFWTGKVKAGTFMMKKRSPIYHSLNSSNLPIGFYQSFKTDVKSDNWQPTASPSDDSRTRRFC